MVEALRLGANIVISGRVTDTGVTLAPMIHEFAWASDDWDRLASGIVGGHIIECGTQCTGGNFTDWQLVEDHANDRLPDPRGVARRHLHRHQASTAPAGSSPCTR